jgi:hypothetical protein
MNNDKLGTRTLEESTIGNLLLMVIAGLGLAYAGYAILIAKKPNNLLWAMACWAIVVGIAWLFKMYFTRGKVPFLQLSNTGFTIPNITNEIPWSAVSDINYLSTSQDLLIYKHNLRLEISFILEPNFQIALKKDSLKRAFFNNKKHTVFISVGGIKAISFDNAVQLISSYHDAHLAQAELLARKG